MSKGKHTPGPWHVGTMNDCLFIINQQPRPSHDEVNFEGSGFATVDNFEIIAKLDYPDADANARLIAAAPDLLDALNRVMQEWNERKHLTLATRQAIDAAIAKAEGQS